MLQKIAFIFVILAAIIAADCGRQVTPNPPGLGAGGAPPGYVSIFFNVEAPFNFSNYQYVIVLNTTGDGRTPSTDTIQTNWDGYTYAIIAQGNAASTFAKPWLFVRSNQNPHIPPGLLPLGSTPQQFSYNLNANGTGTEFQILAQKRIFSATPGPSPMPTSNVWTFNAFVTQANYAGQWRFSDSMGAGGPIDPQFVSPPLDMLTCFDTTYFALDPNISDPMAQIVSIEIANNPISSPCSSS
jgi:hypothetical protein